MSLKNAVTPSKIYPATMRLVAQRLNHYATPGSDYIHTYIRLLIHVEECLIKLQIRTKIPVFSFRKSIVHRLIEYGF